MDSILTWTSKEKIVVIFYTEGHISVIFALINMIIERYRDMHR
jgi:hypothetical protein